MLYFCLWATLVVAAAQAMQKHLLVVTFLLKSAIGESRIFVDSRVGWVRALFITKMIVSSDRTKAHEMALCGNFL